MSKILLVEDNEKSLRILTRRLQNKDYEVVPAKSGKEAVEKTQSERPDLVLMDIRLPDFDGYEATQRIRKQPQGEDIPIIALTAHALAHHRQEALEAGCDDYHAKPVFFQELVQQVEALLQKKNAPHN